MLPGTVSLDVAVSKILYTFCKVRGEKVITGFLNNEPRYLDLILCALEVCNDQVPWEKSYILLLWLSHLLLAPFDLASISGPGKPSDALPIMDLSPDVPSLASRVLAVIIHFIGSATKEQDAASKLLVRLATRPDMQRLHLPTSLVSWALQVLASPTLQQSSSLHTFLGPLRFLVGMTVTPDSLETSGLIPSIYAAGKKLMDDALFAFLKSSAVTKKLVIKLFRNVALLSLQPTSGALEGFFGANDVLEDTIDYLLQSLGDRDTPVRFAASKALSLIILRLDPDFAHEVVQAVLDSMKEDMPRSLLETDFSTVDPLRWHGLTLTLAHALFRRSASPAQLVEIVNALLLALTFEQRGTTGSSLGSNIRDAACFGIWSLSRRYSTAELLSVDASDIRAEDGVSHADNSVIQLVAVHLLLSACLDPAGNIRRGSSAALQELIGRHPDQVKHGIPLVQVVDYHAVGLRQRAVVDVAHGASSLDPLYRKSLLMALLKWRGIGSPDVVSREMAAASIGRLCKDQPPLFVEEIMGPLLHSLSLSNLDVEYCHGSLLAVSKIVDEKLAKESLGDTSINGLEETLLCLARSWDVLERQQPLFSSYTSRSLHADLFSAIARFIASMAKLTMLLDIDQMPSSDAQHQVSAIVARLVSRSEDSTLAILPEMVQALMALHDTREKSLPALELKGYVSKLRVDSSSTTLNGAGRAISLAAAFPWLGPVDACDPAEIVNIIGEIVQTSPAIEWRVVGVQALLIIIESGQPSQTIVEKLVQPLHAGLNNYTITERGDVGSLVRTAATMCVSSLWKLDLLTKSPSADLLLLEDVTRLSLEKLDRTRLQAARCLTSRGTTWQRYVSHVCIQRGSNAYISVTLTDVSSIDYFSACFLVLKDPECPAWERDATLKGCASCAGVGAEGTLQSARVALVTTIYTSEVETQLNLINSLASLLKTSIATGSDSQPLLELLAFLLDAVPSLQNTGSFRYCPIQTDSKRASNIQQLAQPACSCAKVALQVEQHPKNLGSCGCLPKSSGQLCNPIRSIEEACQHVADQSLSQGREIVVNSLEMLY